MNEVFNPWLFNVISQYFSVSINRKKKLIKHCGSCLSMLISGHKLYLPVIFMVPCETFLREIYFPQFIHICITQHAFSLRKN